MLEAILMVGSGTCIFVYIISLYIFYGHVVDELMRIIALVSGLLFCLGYALVEILYGPDLVSQIVSIILLLGPMPVFIIWSTRKKRTL